MLVVTGTVDVGSDVVVVGADAGRVVVVVVVETVVVVATVVVGVTVVDVTIGEKITGVVAVEARGAPVVLVEVAAGELDAGDVVVV